MGFEPVHDPVAAFKAGLGKISGFFSKPGVAGNLPQLPGPTIGGALQGFKADSGKGTSGASTTGAATPDFMQQAISQFGKYAPPGFDIQAAIKWAKYQQDHPKEAAFLKTAGFAPNFQAQQQPSGYNPLQLQTLFSDVLAPQLAKTSQQEQGIADQYSKAMQGILGGNLPANMKQTLQAQVPGEVARMKESAVSQQEMGTMGPFMDALMNQLKSTQTEEAKRYYEDIALKAAGITSGATTSGPFPPGT